MRGGIVEVITDACLFWLPLDILYLYFAGSWHEPNRIILYAELVVLPLISLLAVYRIIRYIRNEGG